MKYKSKKISKLVRGVGVLGEGKYQRLYQSFGKVTKEYKHWADMLKRCYSEKEQERYPRYRGCTLSENFKNFQYFAEWCNNQVGFSEDGWCLDKDILVPSNKHYSEDTCCFVPTCINTLFISKPSKRGVFPVGVSYDKARNKYRAQCCQNSIQKYLGLFETPESAFDAYKIEKIKVVKGVANEWRGKISECVYEAIINYPIEEYPS